ncbi:MAG: hypothetical protein K9M99_05000 [Candidatus Cloacimonetes bacterium]|nr:hypothetical protein [Candidatus Cloacimonadota bacterium]
MKLLRNISIPVDKTLDIEKEICTKLQLGHQELVSCEIRRKSLDARRRNNLVWQYSALIEVKGEYPSHPDLLEFKEKLPYIEIDQKLNDKQPVIIGAGPAGLFAALALADKGFCPIIFDQGDTIIEREASIRNFWQKGILDTQSNVQNGEGGAGTFSDGKLTSRNQDFYTHKVLEYLVQFGASPDILINAHPHLGTDKLKLIVTAIREYLVDKGCEFHWKHKLEDITVENGGVRDITINGEKYSPEIVILAPGNAARELFRMLANKIPLQSKPFAVGFRIEHEQEFINYLFYGDKTNIDITGAAEYRIKAAIGNKSVFSFCMCPGGIVVNAASEKNGLVTNGMSWSKRKGKYANSAIVTPIDEKTFGSEPLAGMQYQEMIEKKCFKLTSSYLAPVQRAIDFIYKPKNKMPVPTTFLPGTITTDLNKIYESGITRTIGEALKYWNKRYKGFATKGVLIAPETRTSSPVRILRQPNMQSEGAENLYVIGEGAGYAGGIISSAAEGLKLVARFEY